MSFLHFISDLHLEDYPDTTDFSKFISLPKNKDDSYLALIGAIGHPASEVYARFLKHVSENFKQIFIIAEITNTMNLN
jgi:UDP-2,3-diacylglucosamine pyrophosphatase LpxH